MMQQSLAFLSLFLFLGSSCRTSSNGSAPMLDNPTYDGSAETSDSLPDCTAESLGSLFWVRDIKTGFECVADKGWIIRSFKAPDEENPSPPTNVVE